MAPAPMAQGQKQPKADLTFIIPADSVRPLLVLHHRHILTGPVALLDRLQFSGHWCIEDKVSIVSGAHVLCTFMLFCSILTLPVVSRRTSHRTASWCCLESPRPQLSLPRRASQAFIPPHTSPVWRQALSLCRLLATGWMHHRLLCMVLQLPATTRVLCCSPWVAPHMILRAGCVPVLHHIHTSC